MTIRGNTVGFPNPHPDWAQTNPAVASFIRNKPNITVDANGFTVISGQRAITAITITESETAPWKIELSLEGGVTETIAIAHNGNGEPTSITAGGVTIPITYWGV